MAKKKIIRKTNKRLNLFKEGGSINYNALGSAVQSSLSGIELQDTSNPYQTAVTGSSSQDSIARMIGDLTGTNVNNTIEDINTNAAKSMSKFSNISDNNSLLNAWDSIERMDSVDGSVGWNDVGDNLMASAQGAQQGMSVGGGWGALIGGIVGGVSNLVSLSGRSGRAKKVNAAIDQYNASQVNAFNTQALNLGRQNSLNALANYSALGGPIDYQLSSDSTNNKYLASINSANIKALPNSFTNNNKFDAGGDLNFPSHRNGGIFSNGVTKIGNGGTHEENPNQGVPMGVDGQGVPNLVEEGEVRYNDYMFSNRLFADKQLLNNYKLPKNYNNHSFADIAERLSKESEERPNDPISKNGLMASMGKLQSAQEDVRNINQNTESNMYADGGDVDPNRWSYIKPFSMMTPAEQALESQRLNNLSLDFNSDESTVNNNIIPNTNNKESLEATTSSVGNNNTELLRYAPAISSGLMSLTDSIGLTNQPNYADSNIIRNATNAIPNVGYKPIGNYLTYKPLDRNYYGNKLAAQAAATRSGIRNLSNSNRANAMAGLLAADYNAQQQMGNLARQAEEYNLNQRTQVEEFNRGTNQTNAQMALQASGMNQDAASKRLSGRISEAQMRDQISSQASAARINNLTNFVDSLGGIGKEAKDKETLQWMAMKGLLGNYGDEDLTNRFGLSPDQIATLRNTKACGGRIKNKKRKGLTY